MSRSQKRPASKKELEHEQTNKEEKRKVKILVVDDEPDMREMLSGILLHKGHEVITAQNGHEAIEIVRGDGLSIIFMDIKMPDMNGVEAYKEIKKTHTIAEMVMMTGYAVENLVKEAMNEGAYACLKKPFEMDDMLNIVEKITDRQDLKAFE